MNKKVFEELESFLIKKLESLEKETPTDSCKKKMAKIRKELVELRLNNPHNWSNFNLLY